MEPVSLYLHFPFCASKCAYCDFASYPAEREQIERYVQLLCEEIRENAAGMQNSEIITLYMGGGTPSILNSAQFERIFEALHAFRFRKDAEITVEANPGSFRKEKLLTWLRCGVNRLSLGVQSFDDGELRMLGRTHKAEQAIRSYQIAMESGLPNVSMDLIYGIPGQDISSWRGTLETALSLRPLHLSCYSLIVEEHTRLRYQLQIKEVPPLPDEDTLAGMEDLTLDRLRDAGLLRYEVSNYAAPGYESRHNMVYWECLPYLGMGCSAHSCLNGARFYNTSSLRLYLTGKPEGRNLPEEMQSPEMQQFERMMMGLRMVRGVDVQRFRRDFGKTPEEIWPESLREFKKNGLLDSDEKRMFLSRRGMSVMNSMLVRMMEEQGI